MIKHEKYIVIKITTVSKHEQYVVIKITTVSIFHLGK
jgi:hypothetical protein